MNQIERLKKNWLAWGGLSAADRGLFRSVCKETDVIQSELGTGEWRVPHDPTRIFCDTIVYRIHEDYQPDKPVFPGYVLCKVKDNGFHLPDDGMWRSVAGAVDCGCCGYVCKERPDVMLDRPQSFVSRGGEILCNSVKAKDIVNGFKPTTLGWVVFKEQNNE